MFDAEYARQYPEDVGAYEGAMVEGAMVEGNTDGALVEG